MIQLPYLPPVRAIAGLCFCLLSLQASAVGVQIAFSGLISSADASNAFGLTTGSQVFVRGVFDDKAVLGTGTETLVFDNSSGRSLQVTLGDVLVDAAEDADFLSGGFPALTFVDGVLSNFDMLTLGTGYSGVIFESSTLAFSAIDLLDNAISGNWDPDSFEITPVPVPSIGALFGLSLLGLRHLRRRQNVGSIEEG